MKIAQIISTPPFAWSTGGPARAVFELSKALGKQHHDVTLLTTNLFHGEESADMPGEFPEFCDGVHVKYFKILGGPLAWKYKVYCAPGLLWFLLRQSRDYTIIHLQDLISFHAIAVLLCSKVSRVPYVLTPHGSAFWLSERKIINRLYYHLFGARLLKNASRIIALTSTEKSELLRLSVPEEKIVIVPNGIPLQEYEILPERGHFRSKYGIGDKQIMILYHGRIHEGKGIDLLVDAFSDLVKSDPDLRLVIAGRDDGFSVVLVEKVKRQDLIRYTTFTGQLGEQEKKAAYVDADVFVLPSVHEGFPITVLEAMACGTPVVVTSGCNIAEILGGCGLSVDRERTLLADAIKRILGDPGLHEQYVHYGREKIREEFTWEIISRKIDAIYHDCLKEYDGSG